jgi:ribosomal protein S18 acetylase RimI-like enzyme
MDLIVDATVEDSEAILSLQRRAYEIEARLYEDWSIPPLTQSLADLRDEFGTAVLLKCVRDGVIVGSVRARLIGGACQVGRLIVEPVLQRQGIGSSLLAAIETRFPGASKFELFTGSRSESNIRLYSRHGYEITATKVASELVTLVFMSKYATAAA